MPPQNTAAPRRFRTTVFCCIALLAVGCGGRPKEAATSRPPNVLLLFIDDMGWNALSSYGNADVETPNIDALAAQGMRFTQAYAQSQCSPSRGILLTGMYETRTGMTTVTHRKRLPWAPQIEPDFAREIPASVYNLAHMFQDSGYATGLSGKWHIAGNYSVAPMLRSEGIDYFNRYGFDFAGNALESEHAEDKAVEAVTDEILDFIEQNADRSWFGYAAHFTVHTALGAPLELVRKHVERGYTDSSDIWCVTSERPTAHYLAMIEHLDTNIGRMLARLDELDLRDNTVVVFVSDNGGLNRMADMAPLREAKGSPYEGGIRVPMIVRWPGVVPAGSESDTPVHLVDLFPTFLQIARGSNRPAGLDHPLDGQSLMPLLTQTPGWTERPLFWHMPFYVPMYGRTPSAVVRSGDFKLVHFFGDYLDTAGQLPIHQELYGKLIPGQRTELYNLADDLGEQRDLAGEMPDKVAELRALLDQWFEDTGAKLPAPNPDYDPARWMEEAPAR